MSEETTVVPDDEYDLDAVVAEAIREPMGFRWMGQHWVLKHASSIDLRTLDDAVGGDLGAMRNAILSAMGEEQAARFNDVAQDASAMLKLFSKWTDRAGATSGESPASPDSSASTEKPSRPASARTTRASSSRSSGKAPSPRAS